MAVGAREWLRVRTEFQRALESATLIFACLSVPDVLASFLGSLLCGLSATIAAAATAFLVISLPDEIECIVHLIISWALIANHKVCAMCDSVFVMHKQYSIGS